MNFPSSARSVISLIVVLFSSITFAQNQAADFSGPGNEVNVTYNLNTVSGYTVEQWIFIPSISLGTPLLNQTSSDVPSPLGAFVNPDASITLRMGDGVSSDSTVTAPGVISPSTWHHVAISFDPLATSSEGLIFIDGISVPVDTLDVTASISNTGPIRIGRRADLTEGDNIIVDEVRIWNVPRNGTAISTDFDAKLTGGESGLEVYLPFENNLNDQALGNGAQDGTIAAGVVGYVSGAPLQNNALNFDGTNDRVSIPRNTLAAGLTFEAWVNTSSADAVSTYPGNAALSVIGDVHNDIRGSFGITGGQVSYQHWTGTSTNFDTIQSVQTVNDGTWHHIAVTHDQTTNEVRIYVDGQLDGQGFTTTYYTNMSFNRIGSSFNGGVVDGDFFNGFIDEVRVWNNVRTQEQISADAYSSLSSGSGLVASYDFNVGVAGSDNSGLTNLPDISPNTNDGTLTGPFALSGATSNWVASTAFDIDIFAPVFIGGYPLIDNISTTGFDITVQLNELGTYFYVVVPDGSATPSVDDVRGGTGSGGSGQVASGNINVTIPATDFVLSPSGLTPNTFYDVYIVAQDDEGSPNVQSVNTVFDVTTEAGFVTTWVTTDGQITIPTTGGGYNYSVEWNNLTNPGTFEGFTDGQVGNYTITGLENSSTYEVIIRGAFPRIYFNNAGDKDKIQSIEQWGNISWTFFQSAFYGCTNLTYNATDAPDLSGVSGLGSMFRNASSFNATDLTSWDVSGITDMGLMFSGATAFAGNVSSWNVSNVVTMTELFRDLPSFNSDISGWVTTSASNMLGMFQGSSSFNRDLSGWDLNGVGNTSFMFFNASSFDQNLGGWDVTTVSNMTNMLSNTATSVANYDAILSGWAAQSASLQVGVTLGVTGLGYSSAGETDRNTLTTAPSSWTISGDQLVTPLAPTNLIAYATSATDITLEWVDNATNETGYTVQQAVDYAFSAPLNIATGLAVDATTYTDNAGVDQGFYYRVIPTNGFEDASSQSAIEFASTGAFPGSAVDFSGNLAAHVRANTFVAPTNNWTYEFWFQPDTNLTLASPRADFFDHLTGDGAPTIIFNRESDGTIRVYEPGFTPGTNPTSSLTSWEAGKWYHIAGVYDGTNVYLYVDGVLEDQISAPGITTTSSDLIIGNSNSINTAFNGAIDEFKVWNIVKTDFSDRYASSNGNESGLVAYYPMDEGTGTAALDASTNTNDGALWNGPIFSPSTFVQEGVVSNTNDAGPGSLRAAIDYANATPGTTITFDISGGGPWLINLVTELPDVTAQGTIIDGTTQPGWDIQTANMPTVDGGGSLVRGLDYQNNNVELYGLHMTNFTVGVMFNTGGTSANGYIFGAPNKGNIFTGNSSNGIQLLTYSGGGTIQSNYFGLLPDSISGSFSNGIGINIGTNGDKVQIGGLGLGEGNVLANNTTHQIGINNADSVTVQGNIVGLSANQGSAPGVGNGVSISSLNAALIEENVIAGVNMGIRMSSANNSTIIRNNIGVASDSVTSFPNTNGIRVLTTGATNNIIGSNTISTDGNIIANSTNEAILFDNASAVGNLIQRNSMFGNTLGIILNGSHNGIVPPSINPVDNDSTVTGTGTNGDEIDLYLADVNGHGEVYLGSATVSGGAWSVGSLTLVGGDDVVATATNAIDGTSEFSAAAALAFNYPAAEGAGEALTFDGTDDVATIPNNPSFENATYTLESWVSINANPGVGATHAFVNKGTLDGSLDANGYSMGYTYDGANYQVFLGQVNGSNVVQPLLINYTLNLGEWYHVAGVYDGTDMILYVNGLEIGRTTADAPDFVGDATDIRIGGYHSVGGISAGDFINAQLDEVRIWDQALQEDGIRQYIARKVTAAHPEFASLVAYYRMDDSGDALNLQDFKGIHNGTISGGSSYILSGAHLGEESFYEYTYTAGSGRSLDGFRLENLGIDNLPLHIYRVDQTPSNNTVSGFDPIDDLAYYGVFAPGQTYDVVDSIGGLTSDRRIIFRNNRADTTWTSISGVLGTDIEQGQIYAYGQVGSGQFATAIDQNPYPTPLDAGYALNFNGSGDQVNMGTASELQITAALTYEFWINTVATTGFVLGRRNSDGAAGIASNVELLGDGRVQFLINDGASASVTVQSSASINDGSWHHVAVTYEPGTNIRIYVDGLLNGETTAGIFASLNPGPLPFNLSFRHATTPNYLAGQLDEVRVWDIALSETNIRDHMISKIDADFDSLNHLVAYYRFDENSGSTAENLAGDINGAITGATPVISGAPQAQGAISSYDGTPGVLNTAQFGEDINVYYDDATGGIHAYLVGGNPNQLQAAGFNNLDQGKYYGVFAPGGQKVDIHMDYSGGNNINRRIVYRTDPTDTAAVGGWEQLSGLVNTSNSVDSVFAFNVPSGEVTTAVLNPPSSYPLLGSTDPGSALNFAAGDEEVVIDNDFNFIQNTGVFTVEFWMRADDLTNDAAIMSTTSATADNGFMVSLNNSVGGAGSIRFASFRGASGQFVYDGNTGAGFITDNNWHHVAIVSDGTSVILYLDGDGGTDLGGTYGTLASGPATNNLALGGYAGFAGSSFNGDLDEVRIWDAAVSQGDIVTYSNANTIIFHPNYSDLNAYYRFDDGTGSTIVEDVFSNNVGTLTNMDENTDWIGSGAFTGAPINNFALDFDGVNDHLIASNITELGTSTGTIEAWINPTTTALDGVSARRIVAKPSGSDNLSSPYQLAIDNNGSIILILSDGATTQTAASNSGFVNPALGWQQVAASWDGSTISFFHEGTMIGTTAQTVVPNTNTANLVMGGFNGVSGSGQYQGALDEVRIWDYSRNDTEISNDKDSFLNGDESGLVAYYSMSDGTNSSIASDITVFGNNATLINMDSISAWVSGPALNPASGGIPLGEDFNFDLPTTTDQVLFLSSGLWEGLGVKSAEDSTLANGGTGDAALMLSGAGNYLTTPSFDGVNQFTFYYRAENAGGNGFVFDVFTSSDGGITFDQEIASDSSNNTTTYQEFNFNFGSPYTGPIRIVYDALGSESGLIDDFYADVDVIKPNVTITTLPVGDTTVNIGDQDVLIYKVQADVAIASAAVEGFFLTILGADSTDFDGFKFYENIGIDNFGSATLIDSSSWSPGDPVPNGSIGQLFTDFYVPGTTAYYYVTADISASANPGVFNVDIPDVEQFGFDEANKLDGGLNQGDSIAIQALVDPDATFTTILVAGGTVDQGSIDNLVYQFSIAATGGTITKEGMIVAIGGDATAADFSANGWKLYESVNSDTGIGGASLIGSTNIGDAAPDSVGYAMSGDILDGDTHYFYLAVDVDSLATVGNSFNVVLWSPDPLEGVGIADPKNKIDGGFVDGETFTIQSGDSTAPTPLISSTESSPTNASPILVDIDFGEVVVGFDSTDVAVGNGTAQNFMDLDGQNYSVEIVPASDGAITVDIADSVAQDLAGNENLVASQFTIIFDGTGPSIAFDQDGLTVNDTNLTGTISDSTDVIQISVDGGTTLSPASNEGNGTWSYDLGADPNFIGDGSYAIYLEASDTLGNTTIDSTGTVTIDQTGPSITFDQDGTTTNDTNLSGTVSNASDIIQISVDGGVTLSAVTNNGDGTWAYDLSADPNYIGDALYNIYLDVADTLGNQTIFSTGTIFINQNGPVVTFDQDGLTTNDLILTGTISDPSEALQISIDGGITLSGATNNGDGTWSYDLGSDVNFNGDDTYSIYLDAVDTVGNQTIDSTGVVTIDLTAPNVEVDILGTSISSPAITGTIDDSSATIDVTVNGETNAATNIGDGTWLLAAGILSDLDDGTYDVSVSATDLVGNVGTDQTVDELVITQEILALQASKITSTGFRANWSEGLDVLSYQVDVSSQSDFSSFVSGYENVSVPSTSRFLNVTGLDFSTRYYYRVRLVNTASQVSANSNTRTTKTIIDNTTLADSLALVQIYDAISPQGLNWETARLRDWDGVTLNDTRTRVNVVNISSSQASGDMPNPFTEDAFANGGLSELTGMDVSTNQITGLMDFSNTSISTLFVNENSLQFDDLEPLVGISTLDYSNQASIPYNQTTDGSPIEVRYANNYSLSIGQDGEGIGGSANVYTWYRNDAVITSGDDYGISDAEAVIVEIDYDNMGTFRTEITNDLVPGLTIDVDAQIVWAVADMEVSITDVNGDPLAAPFNAFMLETTRTPTGFRVLETLENQTSSTFTFPDVVLGDYITFVESDLKLYIPTYFGNVFEWDEADILFFRSDDVISMTMTEVPPPTTGEGTLDVIIEEDFDDDNSRIDARRRAAKRKCGLRRRVRSGRTDQDDDEFELIAYGETDDNGEFQFGFLPQGTYRFFVEYPGIPLDESSFVEFEVGEAGVSDTDFKLQAFASEDGIEVTIEAVLGVILEYFKDLKIYPNPSSDYLNIAYRHLKSNDIVAQMVDLSGNTLWSMDLRNGFDGQLQIDVTSFEEGIYILRFYDRENPKDNVVSFRIMVKD